MLEAVWNKGRVFFGSIGHQPDDLNVSQVSQIMRRVLRAAGGAPAKPKPVK